MVDYLNLEELHQEELRLLLWFDAFCKENKLRYSLQAGTLIGAVRHKGFIPWDDDVDVSMPRPDYDRFLRLSSHFSDGHFVVHAENSDSAAPFAKLCTDAIRAQEPELRGVMEEYLWIDIFVMDGVPEDDEGVEAIQRRCNAVMRRCDWASLNHAGESKAWKKVIKQICGTFYKFNKPKEKMLRFINELACNPGYENATRVSSLLGGAKHGWSLPKDGYESMVDLEFEGHMFPAMGCWDEYLTKCYGDYMQLPPENKRQTHCLKAWRVDEGGVDAGEKGNEDA